MGPPFWSHLTRNGEQSNDPLKQRHRFSRLNQGVHF